MNDTTDRIGCVDERTRRALDIDRGLALAGVPIFIARRRTDGGGEFWLPRGWERTVADPAVVDAWRPGDALCAVMGVVVDGLDIDSYKPEAEESVRTLHERYGLAQLRRAGVARTSSGGLHYLTAPMGVGSRNSLLPGVDLKGGKPDGSSRGFLYLAPTRRVSKATGEPTEYAWEVEPDLAAIAGDDVSWEPIAELVRQLQGGQRTAARPAGPTSTSGSVSGPVFVEPVSVGSGSDIPAGRDVVEHMAALRARLAGWGDGANAEAASTAAMFGGYVAAGQVSRETAEGILLSAFEGWTWAKPGDERTMRNTVLRQLGWGVANGPRPYVPTSAPFGPQRPAEAVPADPPDLNILEEFWSARASLTRIRAAAHARRAAADVVLYAVLARLAALWPHEVRADTGIGMPASLNLFVAVAGPSGTGKTAGVGLSRALLAPPPWLADQDFADGRPVGTGEGLAEAYMGSVKRASNPLDPNSKTTTVRAQVRHNALFYADEGEALAKLLERQGATIGETLRRAWTGATLGQQNGRSETTRVVDAYSMGLVVGFQEETCQALLADVNPGTPQRFVWCWAQDPHIPTERPAALALDDVWAAATVVGDGVDTPTAVPDRRPVTFDQAILDVLDRQRLAIARGEPGAALPRHDSHQPLTLVKLAALLAALDGGRRHVGQNDWALAWTLWSTSCRVRDHLLAWGHTARGEDRKKADRLHADREALAESARITARSLADDEAVVRVARRLAAYVSDAGSDGVAPGALRRRVVSRDRHRFDEAVEYACGLRWLIFDGGRYSPGSSMPS